MSNSKKLFYALFIITIVYAFIAGAIWTYEGIDISSKLFWTGMLTLISYGIPVGIYLAVNDK